MRRLRRIVATAVSVACAAGCAASATAPGSKTTALRTQPAVRADVASTPQRAAIGFDESIRRERGNIRYLCARTATFSVLMSAHVRGAPRASAIRRGMRWVVTVAYENETLNRSRYEVRHRANGYCVSRMLTEPRPRFGPSTVGNPGTYTPSTTPRPSKS